ncbi:MAG: hypothetical protein JWN93_997 [Hyphomicrobiales bacterium]|nr:hypothetical protein [Hyphomicrobiales bacterium]
MNMKHIVVLSIAAVAAVAATAVTLRTAPQNIASDKRGELVFRDLIAKANDIATITVRDNEKAFSVERRDNGFFDKDSGYPARAESFRDIVGGVGTLAFEETKTSDPARYGDIGLADPGQGEKSGREVTIRDARSNVLASVIVGNRDTTVGGARGGVYLRFPGSPQTWLARGEVRVPQPHTAWFEINLVNLNKDALAKLELRGGGLDDVTIASEPKGSDLKLDAAPEGRAPDSGKLMRLSFMVDPLSFQDVRKPVGEAKADARKLIAYGHNGLKITVTSVGDEWVRMAAEATSDEAKAQAEDLSKKIDGFEFKLSKNDADMLAWGLKDFTMEPKS